MIRIHTARCNVCGFNADATVGAKSGQYNDYDAHPALCLDCGVFDAINTARRPHMCSECDSENVVLYGERTRKASTSTGLRRTAFFLETRTPWFDGLHTCPNCGQHGLTFGIPKLYYS